MSKERSGLENMTFESLDKVLKIYDTSDTDQAKLYHISSAISILVALKTFLVSKMEIATTSQKVAENLPISGNKQMNISVSGDVTQSANTKKNP